MHIAQPLIVVWYLRCHKRIALCLVAYDAVMAVAICLLEWHYFVDLLGGAIVAALAIVIVRSEDHPRDLATSNSWVARPWRSDCSDELDVLRSLALRSAARGHATVWSVVTLMSYFSRDALPTEIVAPQGASDGDSESITIPEKSGYDWCISLLILFLSIAYLRLFYNYTLINGDEGIVLQGAQRVLRG